MTEIVFRRELFALFSAILTVIKLILVSAGENENSSLPSYECHMVYGVPTNGKLYNNIATKG